MKDHRESQLIEEHARTHGYQRIERVTAHAPTARTRGAILRNVIKATAKRNADAADRAQHQGRLIKVRLLELAGPAPDRAQRSAAVKIIAAEMKMDVDMVNFLLRKLADVEGHSAPTAAAPSPAIPKRITIFDVVSWMKGVGMDIDHNGSGRFIMNGRQPVTHEIVLYIANKRRCMLGMAPFPSEIA